MVRLGGEKLVSWWALAGWLIPCSAGTHSPCFAPPPTGKLQQRFVFSDAAIS